MRPPKPKVWDGDPRSPTEQLITTYHATLSDTMKRIIESDWKAGRARIMISTSAWGMGIDDPDVERVIQWGVRHLKNLDTVMQRFGRFKGISLLAEEHTLRDRVSRATISKARPQW
ncbi:hypothetical protein EV426DRAFT_539315 [Tirmania nivea]|nr:hypothetical protein EV426DRAFT_539315 [Tirmania nivea]